jgi:hypothetical protein
MRVLKIAAVVVFTLLAIVVVGTYFSEDHQQFLAFKEQRDAWHRKCDAYIDQPVTSPQAQACQRELNELMAHAKRQGWDK